MTRPLKVSEISWSPAWSPRTHLCWRFKGPAGPDDLGGPEALKGSLRLFKPLFFELFWNSGLLVLRVADREALEGPGRPARKTIWRTLRFLGLPYSKGLDELLACDLPGPLRSPQGLGAPSPEKGLLAPELPRFGAFALLEFLTLSGASFLRA